MIYRIISVILVVAMISMVGPFVPRAKAIPVFDASHTATSIYNGITSTIISATEAVDASVNASGWIATLGKWAVGTGAPYILLSAKALAFIAIQKSMQAMIGKGDGLIIRDYNDYLFLKPKQQAMMQMDTFFNTVSRGRSSVLNYEGVGPNYDAYLIAQARQSIMGHSFSTNIQNYATNPQQLFAGGNMKGIMSYMQCANNVACYTLTAQNQYEKELARAKEIAKEEGKSGFMPQKENGRITKPAELAKNALTQVDQLGTQVIMDAALTDNAVDSGLPSALNQVAQGTAITIAGRLGNYGLSDAAGREAIRNKNDQQTMSLGYTLGGGFGASIGGVQVNTGAAAFSGQIMIGNTCAVAGGDVNGTGATVMINGVKTNCPTAGQANAVAPSAVYVMPSITCTQNSQCTPGIIPAGTFICKQSKCVKP